MLENVLAGGVNESLHLDGHGKTLAFLLLDLPLCIPMDMATQLPAVPVPQHPFPAVDIPVLETVRACSTD